MDRRSELHEVLCTLLGSRNVYYQPPASKEMKYPCIRYSKSSRDANHANNKKYLHKQLYDIVVIDRMPDNPVIEKILELPYSDYDRWYVADNLNHDSIKLYY